MPAAPNIHARIMHRAILKYLESLTVTQGPKRGQPFEVLPWERKFIRGAFAVEDDVALSMGRGGGKTTFVAALACAILDPDGPLHAEAEATDAVIAASSFGQGLRPFRAVQRFLTAKGYDLHDRKVWRMQDSQNAAALEYRSSKVNLACIGSDPRRAHGFAASTTFCDELSQWEPSKTDPMLAALRTGAGKIDGSRLIAIGTRPAASWHPFAKMLEGGAAYSQLHAARPGDPVGSRSTWKRANPSLDFMPALEKRIRRELEEARSDPALMPPFRALRLNLGVPDHEQAALLDAGTWESIEGDGDASGRYALGVDLGSGAAMSAAAGYFPSTGALKAFAVFPELPGLADRGLRDGVGGLYADMAARGELLIAGRRVADVGRLLEEALDRWGRPAVIVCDRWREAELRDVLDAVGFPQTALTVRGQGFKDGGEDVRLFRRACLGGEVKPERSLLLRAAMAEARVATDPAANAKLAKRTQGGRRANARDDAVAAAILAVAEGVRRESKRRARGRGRRIRIYGAEDVAKALA